jgi:hypothetical protein
VSRSDTALDLISATALAGSAAMMLIRPRTVTRVAAAAKPVAPHTRELMRAAIRRLKPPAESAPRLPAFPRIAHLLSSHMPGRDLQQSRALTDLITAYTPQRRHGTQALSRAAGRRLNDSAAMLAFSVLTDSAVEHYRGSFQNRAMYIPLVTAALTLCGSLFGSLDPRAKAHLGRDAIYTVAAATGFAGLGFHAYNVLKRPSGLSWLNLFYAAPVGAPMALALAGLLGRGAERVRNAAPGQRATLLKCPAGRTLAALSAAGLAGTVGEAALLHFRGAYHDPAMFLPVTVPPIAAASIGAAALSPSPRKNRMARWLLRSTALLGFVGVGFHVFGVARNMGGWRNWSQNVLNGPPLPAPPSFTGLALAGLAALSLIEEESNG